MLHHHHGQQMPNPLMLETMSLEALDAILSPVSSRRDDFLLTPTYAAFKQQHDQQHPMFFGREDSTSNNNNNGQHGGGEDLTSWLSFLDSVEKSQQRPSGSRLFSPIGQSRKRLRTSFLANFTWEQQQQGGVQQPAQQQDIFVLSSDGIHARPTKMPFLETNAESSFASKLSPKYGSLTSMESYWISSSPHGSFHSGGFGGHGMFHGLALPSPAGTMVAPEVPPKMTKMEPPAETQRPVVAKVNPKPLSPGSVSAHSGEMRLRINFLNYGTVDDSTPVFGKSGFYIPNGLCGTHDMYDQRWRFEIRHEKVSSPAGVKKINGRVVAESTVLITWIITNETSGSTTCVTETPQQAALRELSGRTICNKVVRMALNNRAQEIEDSLESIEDENQRQAAATAAHALRPRLCTVGLLFFGLLHEGVQLHLRSLAQKKNL